MESRVDVALRIPCSRRETADIVLEACGQNRISDGGGALRGS